MKLSPTSTCHPFLSRSILFKTYIAHTILLFFTEVTRIVCICPKTLCLSPSLLILVSFMLSPCSNTFHCCMYFSSHLFSYFCAFSFAFCFTFFARSSDFLFYFSSFLFLSLLYLFVLQLFFFLFSLKEQFHSCATCQDIGIWRFHSLACWSHLGGQVGRK